MQAEQYAKFWAVGSIDYDLAEKSVKKIYLDKPPRKLRASASFYLLFPPELQTKLKQKLFDAPPERRKEIWDSFGLDIKEIDKRFKKMIEERTKFAIDKGHTSKIGQSLDWYEIPRREYEDFVKNKDKVINFYNQQLPKEIRLPEWFYSEFKIPCLMCLMKGFPFKTLEETLDYVSGKYEILGKFKSKIYINTGDRSTVLYKKETDSFEITIDKYSNTRHQIIDLIHELSHVLYYLESFSNSGDPFSKGTYIREKEAAKVESTILKKLSLSLYKALFVQNLLLLHRVLFEIEIYKKPNQDLDKLYARIFDHCFKSAGQKRNLLYLMDERIIFSPLSSLPHAVAEVSIFQKLADKLQNK